HNPGSTHIRFFLSLGIGLSRVELAARTVEKVVARVVFKFYAPTGNSCAIPEKIAGIDRPIVSRRNPPLVKDALSKFGEPHVEMVGSVDDEHTDAGFVCVTVHGATDLLFLVRTHPSKSAAHLSPHAPGTHGRIAIGSCGAMGKFNVEGVFYSCRRLKFQKSARAGSATRSSNSNGKFIAMIPHGYRR